MPEPKKRFIAGAVCPKCSAMDRIVMYRLGELDYRECVECGFKDEMRFKQTAQEIPTRVNVTEQDKALQTQTIKIVELPKNKPGGR